jgi:hypothetical protein
MPSQFYYQAVAERRAATALRGILPRPKTPNRTVFAEHDFGHDQEHGNARRLELKRADDPLYARCDATLRFSRGKSMCSGAAGAPHMPLAHRVAETARAECPPGRKRSRRKTSIGTK